MISYYLRLIILEGGGGTFFQKSKWTHQDNYQVIQLFKIKMIKKQIIQKSVYYYLLITKNTVVGEIFLYYVIHFDITNFVCPSETIGSPIPTQYLSPLTCLVAYPRAVTCLLIVL